MILSLKMFWALKFSRNLVNTSRVVRGKIVKLYETYLEVEVEL